MSERERREKGAGHRAVGRRSARPVPKGRSVDPSALEEVRAALDDLPRRPDLLIEALHRIQDRFRGLGQAHLTALAHELGLSMTEVFEVASFYAHFDLIGDDGPDPAARPVTVRVCDSLACSMAGADRLRDELRRRAGPGLRVARAPCMGRCDRAPNVAVGRRHISRATADTVLEAAAGPLGPVVPEPVLTYERYVQAGGYALLRACRSGARDRDELVATVEASGLRGLGGAGFRSGQKWRLVRQGPSPRLMVVNADEGEPGTFKDRHHLETDPHRFLEGTLIAAWAVEAEAVYIYLRDEYPEIHGLLTLELARLRSEGLIGPPEVHLRRGAGAYICGEETAMLESLEGKRGYPRQKPPYPTQEGLFGRPTLIHNVETVYWLRDILEHVPGWLASFRRNGRSGLRSYSVSGRVVDPGVKLAPAGITVRQLIEEHCGGMLPGHVFKGYLPGGASGGILPAHLGDVPLDFGTLEPYGCFIGSAAVVVLSDQDDVRAIALDLMRFFADESCGQCTPCRLGTEKALLLMERPHWDEPLLTSLSAAMRDASICGLGQAAPNPMLCALRYFPEDLR